MFQLPKPMKHYYPVKPNRWVSAERCNSIANAMELHLSRINPSMWTSAAGLTCEEKLLVSIYLLIVSMSIPNCCSAETGIFQENQINITAADALTPCIARPSAAMILSA